MIKLVEMVVNSHVNGVVMVPILIWIVWTMIGQAVETIEIFKEVE